MPETTQWYYMEDQQRKGPVAQPTILKLAAEGVITDKTLVWKAGMRDWQAAGKIPGLLDPPAQELPKVDTGAPTQEKPKAQRFKPADSASPVVTPTPQQPASESPLPAATTATAATAESLPRSIQAAPRTEPRATTPDGRGPLLLKVQWIGYPCLIAGFLLVIGSKGCDSLGNRWASRLNANAQIAEAKFTANYERQKNALQARLEQLQQADDPNPQRLTELNQELRDLTREQSEQSERLKKTTWYDLEVAARLAQANNQSWGYFRELVFVLGSMVLSVGLLVLGITGNSSEKWTCLIMLAIITFSIYIGGLAWIGSIAGNAGTGNLGL